MSANETQGPSEEYASRSQFGDLNAGGEPMDVSKWEEVWERGMTKFHLPYVHP